ncbi:methyltransferase family protein [Candidatus Nitrosacidococcus tergens]|uniref:Uncharacterized protein n=1 Tax=Candidatus Nitrosacidococcus tergens TaxID=553981 RepID=A0A7G1Q990_9GAMM|nr:methyltransferase [Candidatus Nitrosacidococcus tergens]CAB1275567.1 conserved membrane protein of unknown function [Candidatus Nitrosacidococcus tergens]
MKEEQKSLFIRYGDFIFKYRNGVFPIILAILFLSFSPINSDYAHINLAVDLLGFFIYFFGEGIRVMTIGLTYIKRGGKDKQVYADNLIIEGIFAHCRNPLYLGNLFIFLSFFIIHGNIWVYILGTLFFLTAYNAMVAAEEFFLQQKFDIIYIRYCSQVNRWLPKITGLKDTFKQIIFDWRQVIGADYSSAYSSMMVILLTIYYKQIDLEDSAIVLSSTQLLKIGIVLTSTMAVIKFLKKKGYLSKNR